MTPQHVEHVAPRDGLIRMGSTDIEVRGDGDGRTLVGYVAPFNSPTVINSWEGKFREVIAPGAFKRTLQRKGTDFAVLFNHGLDSRTGQWPLGTPTVVREDATGLYVEVPLSDTSYNNDLAALLRDKAIRGMSFKFSIPEGGDTWERPAKGLPVRTLTEINLAEFGPVTFPAYEATTVGIRTAEDFSTWQSLDPETRDEVARLIYGPRSDSHAASPDDERHADVDTDGHGVADNATTPPGSLALQRDAITAKAALAVELADLAYLLHKE